MSLREKLSLLGLNLSDSQESTFHTLTHMLLDYNSRVNITGITDSDKIHDKHYFDSLAAMKFIPENAKLCDIGTGGGFPAIPIAIMRPDVEVTALESVGKKIRFVEQCSDILKLNIRCVNARAEDHMKVNKGAYDILTFRAFSDLKKIILFAPLLNKNGAIIAYKGQEDKARAELSQADCSAFASEIFFYILPDSGKRTLIILKNKG